MAAPFDQVNFNDTKLALRPGSACCLSADASGALYAMSRVY
jgi:hypothetical protein